MKDRNADIARPATRRLFDRFIYWTGDWGGKVTLASGACTVLYLLFIWSNWGRGSRYIVNDIVTIVVYFGVFLMALRVSRHPGLPLRVRRAWRLFALAYLIYTAGTALWGYFEIVTKTKPFPSWADAAYLSYYPLMLSGLLLFVARLETFEERVKVALDTAIVTLGGGMLVWYFLLRPIAQTATGSRLMMILSLAYPVSDLIRLI